MRLYSELASAMAAAVLAAAFAFALLILYAASIAVVYLLPVAAVGWFLGLWP